MNRSYTVLSFLLVLLCALGTGCSAAGNPVPPGAPVPVVPAVLSPTPPSTDIPTEEISNGIAIRVSSESNKFNPGASATLTLSFEPIITSVTRRSDGSILAVSQKPWPDSPVAQMEYCVSTGATCEPTGAWLPFKNRVQVPVQIDWVGTREIWVVAQFRDASGSAMHGIDENQRVAPKARANTRLTGLVDERTPDTAQAPFVQTLVAPTRLAFPVKGSVVIAGGNCCVGGKVGTEIEIPVTFEATSAAGPVTEMRVALHCPDEGQVLDTAWEPFTARKTYKTTAALNFVGWYVSVQYRDAKDNLSPVYCDDVSVEGSP